VKIEYFVLQCHHSRRFLCGWYFKYNHPHRCVFCWTVWNHLVCRYGFQIF